MRLLIGIESLSDCSFDLINKHAVQGMIYSLLRDTDMSDYHDSNKFKFFTFSDIFPIGDFKKGVSKSLLISSPFEALIETLWKSLKNKELLRLKSLDFRVKDVKKFILVGSHRLISGSPIVLYKNNRANEYYSFERDGNLDFFLERLKENAVKKYNAFYNENFSLDENIFDRLIFKKEVAVKDFKDGNEFILIGSVWKVLEKFEIRKEHSKFYQFILDCGLGEKNSLGFGFVNPVRQRC